MARGDVRIAVTMACEDCKRRNYQTNKSRRNSPDRIELRKFCRWCGKPHGAQGDALAPMAKTRAQRKAERRAREEQERKRSGDERAAESRAQHDTQVPVSGEVAEVEAVEAGIAAGAPEARWRPPTRPKPSRAERRAEAKALKEAEKRQRAEQKRRESEQLAKKQKQAQAERQRGGVHRLPRLLLGRAEEGPVARPRHPGPGNRRHDHLRRRRRRLPRRPRRRLQLPHQADPLAGSPNKGFQRCIAGT